MLKTRRICNPNGRGKVVPVVLVQADSGFAAHKLLSRETLRLAAGGRGWLEEISKARDSIDVAVLRLDREAVRNGWHTHVVPAHTIGQRKVTLHTPLVLCEQRQILFINC